MTTFNMKLGALRNLCQWDPVIVRMLICIAFVTAVASAALMTHPFSVWNWKIIAKGITFFSFALVILLYIMVAIVPDDGVSTSVASPLVMFYMMLCFCWLFMIMAIVRGFLHWW
jgi:hypothetical protein